MVAINDSIRKKALAAVDALSKQGTVRAAFLFGSHVQGRANEWSDIDVAAFMDEAGSWDPFFKIDMIIKVQREIGYDVEPHIFESSQFEKPEAASFAADIIQRGVRIA
jgi:predicted nucleotidyltransferase